MTIQCGYSIAIFYDHDEDIETQTNKIAAKNLLEIFDIGSVYDIDTLPLVFFDDHAKQAIVVKNICSQAVHDIIPIFNLANKSAVEAVFNTTLDDSVFTQVFMWQIEDYGDCLLGDRQLKACIVMQEILDSLISQSVVATIQPIGENVVDKTVTLEMMNATEAAVQVLADEYIATNNITEETITQEIMEAAVAYAYANL